ncbi:MAG: hypothetical protein JST86_13850 [Bacteroidetes bacterium]|nr:hypothetical protein [Bacteroidota bacterium]
MKKISLLFTFSVLVSFLSIAQNTVSTLPSNIAFDHQVVQQTNDEDGSVTTTYYFTVNGDYAMAKRTVPGEGVTTILYTKDGQMCTVDEENKTITIMTMPKLVGEGAQMGKAIAEKINKKPLPKDAAEKITVTKTGKTKNICGYTAYEYEIKNEGGSSSWWYAKVDFDPVKIYTMGAGNSATAIKLQGDDALKNNPAAIPVLNKNFLWAEAEASGKKGMETKSISKTAYSFSTAGYTIKSFVHKGLKDVLKAKIKSLK